MKKLGFISLVFCLVSQVWGMPNYTGIRGLREVISADVEPTGRFNYIFGLRTHWMTSNKTIDSLFNPLNDTWHYNGKEELCLIADAPLGMGFAFSDYLSLNLNTVFSADIMRTNVNVTGSKAISYGWNDMSIGMKFTPSKLFFSPELTQVVVFGIYPMISFPLGEEREDPTLVCSKDSVPIFNEPCRLGEGGLHRFYTADGLTAGGKALLTFNLGEVPKLPVHLNFGYMSYPYTSDCSKISYGMGIEVIYPKFAPFIEIYGVQRVNKDYDDGGIYISPALRFETAENIWMTLTGDFRVSSEKPDIEPKSKREKYHIQGGFGSAPQWAIGFTISQGFDFMPPPPADKAVIAGKVMDKTDGKPVIARISLADTTVTTDEKGNYEVKIPAGKVVVYASPLREDEYKPSPEVTKYAVSGAKEIINFRLEPKEMKKLSILTGRMIDKVSREPCIAIVSFPEAEFPEVKSDINGVYRTDLPAGTYVVKVGKSGYIPQTHPVVLKAGATTVLDFELTPSARVSTLAGKVVDYSSRKGIKATISFPNTEIPDINTDAETGTYKAEIPAGTHQVKVNAVGYVPEGAVVVCNPEATTVKDFELFKKEEKIVLHGITFEFNRADIKPSSYSILDEAVELLKKHPEIRIEIGGHTDWVGSDSYNLELSALRAESVKRYLIEHGISASMLITRGYGESQPIASNSTEAGRAQNRRIEFRILSQ